MIYFKNKKRHEELLNLHIEGLDKTVRINISGTDQKNLLRKTRQELYSFRAFLRVRKLDKLYATQWKIVKDCIIRTFPDNSLYIYKRPNQNVFQVKKVC
jgi:hypothetical protein